MVVCRDAAFVDTGILKHLSSHRDRPPTSYIERLFVLVTGADYRELCEATQNKAVTHLLSDVTFANVCFSGFSLSFFLMVHRMTTVHPV